MTFTWVAQWTLPPGIGLHSPQADVITCRSIHYPRCIRAICYLVVQCFDVHGSVSCIFGEVFHNVAQQGGLSTTRLAHDNRESTTHFYRHTLKARLAYVEQIKGNITWVLDSELRWYCTICDNRVHVIPSILRASFSIPATGRRVASFITILGAGTPSWSQWQALNIFVLFVSFSRRKDWRRWRETCWNIVHDMLLAS